MQQKRKRNVLQNTTTMNKARRKEIKKALSMIEDAMVILESVRDEEQEAFDNLPESLQYSEKGETMEEYVDDIDSAISDLDSIISELDDIINR